MSHDNTAFDGTFSGVPSQRILGTRSPPYHWPCRGHGKNNGGLRIRYPNSNLRLNLSLCMSSRRSRRKRRKYWRNLSSTLSNNQSAAKPHHPILLYVRPSKFSAPYLHLFCYSLHSPMLWYSRPCIQNSQNPYPKISFKTTKISPQLATHISRRFALRRDFNTA